MKERRVKFLAFEEVFFIGKRKDLVFSKDDVKEFDFYDIQVINYNDLQIHVGNFIKEIDWINFDYYLFIYVSTIIYINKGLYFLYIRMEYWFASSETADAVSEHQM